MIESPQNGRIIDLAAFLPRQNREQSRTAETHNIQSTTDS